ncbi:serine protease, partial [Streptomyces sp. Wh19]|nr:serine protease [Streptomyces sp. Wh19]
TPPERPTGGAAGGAGPTLAVIGLDEDPQPHRLVPLLARVRTLGFRLLVVVRDSNGDEVTEVARQLLLPALDERAAELVRRVEDIEREWAGLSGLVESASLGPLPRTEAARHRRRLAQLRTVEDPRDRLNALRALLRELRAELERHGRADVPGPRGEQGGTGGR